MAAVAANDVMQASEQERNEVLQIVRALASQDAPQAAFVGRTKLNIGCRKPAAGRAREFGSVLRKPLGWPCSQV